MHHHSRTIPLLFISAMLSACAPAPQAKPAEERMSGTGNEIIEVAATESPNEKTPATTDSLEVSESSGSLSETAVTASGTIVTEGNESTHHLMVFFDYDCTYCKEFLINDLPWIMKEAMKGRISIERIFVPMSEDGDNAARLAICAAKQEKFSEADEWLATHALHAIDRKNFANTIGLNLQKLVQCTADKNLLVGNQKKSEEYGIERVPFFVIGRDFWLGLLPKEELQKRIEAALRK